ncbi:MAG: hypothetical protein ACYTG5_18835 [Planctomycetota bacterium]
MLKIACLPLLTACEAYPEYDFNLVDASQIVRPEQSVTMSYSADVENPAFNQRLRQLVLSRVATQFESIAFQSPFFSEVRPEPDPGLSDVHFDILMRGKNPSVGSQVSALFSILTYCLWPTKLEKSYSLTARVTARGGQSREYEFCATSTAWFSVAVLFWSGGSGPHVIELEIYDQLMTKLIHDAHRDGLLSTGGANHG